MKIKEVKKILLTLLIGIFLISLVSSAQENLGIFALDDCIDLTQTCTSCTYNNITSIIYPNGTKYSFSPEQNMVRSSTEYLFQTCNFSSQIGEYIVNGYGDLSGTDTVWNYDYEITTTGTSLETSESVLYIIILITTFLLFLAFLFPAIKLPYSNKVNSDGSITRIAKAKYLKLLSVWFAYGFFMWFLQTLNGISKSFITLPYLSNFITDIFTYSQFFSVGITILILAIIFIEIWKDIILSKTIKRYGKAFIDGRLQ